MAKQFRGTLLSGLALASALTAWPASAQQASTLFATASIAKTQAILGNQPSQLAAILSAQQGGSPVRSAPLRPAAYSFPVIRPAIVRAAGPSLSASTGRPDVFGSVALRVTHTPLDARWRRAQNAPVTGAAAIYASALRQRDSLERLEAVNRYVNHRVGFVDDSRQFGRADVWSSASDTFRRGRGDCEDYAIAKLQMLRRAGISSGDLYLVIVKDLVRRADHAVLVARAAGRMYVLDNGTDRLLESDEIADYRPILTFGASGAWTHGYRIARPAMVMASAEAPTSFPAASALR